MEPLRTIIEDLFGALAAPSQNSCSLVSEEFGIIYPLKSGNVIRFSEQEIKQIFISLIERKKNDYVYSVETPTKYRYRFSGFMNKDYRPKVYDNTEAGYSNAESARVDVSLYNNIDSYPLLTHIEFKANQPTFNGIEKDLLKLLMEPVDLQENYFIHVLNKSDKGTWRSLADKYRCSINSIHNSDLSSFKVNNKVIIYLLSLSPKCGYRCVWDYNKLSPTGIDTEINPDTDISDILKTVFSEVSVL